MSAGSHRLRSALDDRLVERAVGDAAAAIAAQRRTLGHLRESTPPRPSDADLAHLGRALQRLAEYLRWSGEHLEALGLQDEAIELWDRLDRPKAALLVGLRRALSLHALGRTEQAYAALDALAELSDAPGDFAVYRDIAAEYRARCLFADALYDAALEAAELALRLRLDAGRAAAQIEATRAMLERIVYELRDAPDGRPEDFEP